MARHTVTSSEIPHLWYHQTQDSAKNSGGSFYFEGKTVYSYGTHFPIATHVENANGEKAVLFTTEGYSISTSGHKNSVWAAIPRGTKIFHVPLKESYLGMKIYMDDFARRIKEASEAVGTPRIREATRLKHFTTATSLIEEANEFAAFFGMKTRFKTPESFEGLRADMEAYQVREAARIAREAKAKEKKERAAREGYRTEHAADLIKWLDGDTTVAFGYNYYSGVLRGDMWDTAFLRVITPDETEMVETSLGVTVPLAHAKLVLRIVIKTRKTKTPYQRNGHTIHIGHYALDSIDVEGNVKAGCHNITWAEIERFANKYGLMPAEEEDSAI